MWEVYLFMFSNLVYLQNDYSIPIMRDNDDNVLALEKSDRLADTYELTGGSPEDVF